MKRPVGITIVAVIFLLIAAYFCGVGFIMLAWPGWIKAGLPVPLEIWTVGPYGALVVGVVWGLIGRGLLKLHDWARVAAMLVIVVGIGLSIPRLVSAASQFRWWMVWVALQIAVRLAILWYLFSAPVAQHFSKSGKTR
jgi:hypothetical protein